MGGDWFPRPVSDPEAEGLPGTADDDSTAYDGVDSPRIADGPDPAALPADRPTAVGTFGTTAEEARAGESLELKVARERPDPALDEASERPDAAEAFEAFDAEPLDEDLDRVDPATSLDLTDPVVAAHADSPVSVYDTDDRPIGRLVRLDEADPVAWDAGAAGGAPTAEESAIHPSFI